MKTQSNFDLKLVSWVKIGGPAKNFIEVSGFEEFRETVSNLIKDGERFEVLGWGANTLISDKGIDKTVIRDKTNFIEVEDKIIETDNLIEEGQNMDFVGMARHKTDKEKGSFFGMEYEDIVYDESDKPQIRVKVSAGTGLPYVINSLISKGITGLQMFSGIPGTIGGSVFNNIHGGPNILSEFIDEVEVVDREGNTRILKSNELTWGYNKTTFQSEGMIIISAVLKLRLGDKDRARHASVEWAKRKATQPKNSLGSTFHNLEQADVDRLGFPMPGAGYFIDKVLNLGGLRNGQIMIPDNTNRNIFVNLGGGTAEEYLGLMKQVYKIAYEKHGLKLKPEVFFKGFDPEETKEFF